MGAYKLRFEASNHLGNVLTLFTDKKIPVGTGSTVSYYKADLVSSMDYSPFGAPLKGRTFNGSGSRYGFNGQEKDDEIVGSGNIYTAEFWEYDSRLGRRWNIDPVVKPWESSYATFADNPIYYDDPDGDDVGYAKFRDRVNVFVKRLTSRKFREQFNKYKNDHNNLFTYSREKNALSLGGAKPSRNDFWEENQNDSYNQFQIKYDKFDSWRIAIAPIQIGGGLLTGLGIGLHNLFTDKEHDIGWGFANRIETMGKINVLSWGFGNYNKYNMFGMKLGTAGEKPVKINPSDGLIGFRFAYGSMLQPINFIDIGNQIIIKNSEYHLHFNFVKKSKRNRKLNRENIIDLRK
ncbi:MAG: hypothetical protein H7331_11370 [Bacteroidia bacterium]|nr:hypothetical protein [Bacteroidia bacterium]